MGKKLLEVRIRPFRIAVLVNREADTRDLLLVFELFSKLWGGRFGQVLGVDSESPEELTAFRLGESRPEFVYGVGLNDDKWEPFVLHACQPRKYSRLHAEDVANIRQAHPQNYLDDHYQVDHALVHLMRTRDTRYTRHRQLRLVSTDSTGLWPLLAGAVFGVHHSNLLEQYRDEVTDFSANTATEFVKLATEFVTENQQSWLDVTGNSLIPLHSGCGPVSPTVVIVREPVPDLSLFWNLRSACSVDALAWVIPVPESCLTEPGLLDALKAWLLAFIPYGQRPNYCHITSMSVDEATCGQFACCLKETIVGTGFETVDYEPPRNRLPVVIPFEYETSLATELFGRTLTFQPPRPKAFESIASPRAWVVDLRKDLKTGRAVGELQLPPNRVAFELLNGPCPPNFNHSIVDRIGNGHDCVNVICSGLEEMVRLYLPTAEEVLLESLREDNVEPVADEKRASYLPIIHRFGGLYRCATAFSGQSGSVLVALTDATMTHRELKSTCRLGKGNVTGETYTERIEWMIQHTTERIRRIARQRFKKHAKYAEPENLELDSVLEYWADRSVLTRHWKLGPCRHCRQQYFVPSLNIQKRVVCTHCGHRITLPATVPLAYTLHSAVKLAVSEGIVPVVLTGRFLRNMSHRGFLWLPGVKYQLGTKSGDIDLLACCDGHLVFCECKKLDQTPPEATTWDEIAEQFLETVEVAKRCRGSLAVLAAQVKEYPEKLVQKIAVAVGNSIPYLLLTKTELENGFKESDGQGLTRNLRLDDVLPVPFPERRRQPTEITRTIDMGWGVYTV